MPVEIRGLADGEAARCEEILRSLPDWFGIESAIVDHVRDIREMETWVAAVDGEVVGFRSDTASRMPAAFEMNDDHSRTE